MDYEAAAKDLKQIRATIGMTASRSSRDPGWFFLIHGALWMVGFLVTQFVPALAPPLWIALSIIASGAMAWIGAALYGKKGRQRHPGLASRIVGISIGIVIFDVLLVISLGLTNPADFTTLAILSTAFCFFVVGLITRQMTSVMGAFMGLSIFAARLLFPGYLYLSIAILGGGSLLLCGAVMLLRKEKTDA